MPYKSSNKNLKSAKSSKQDEFFIQLSDIEKEPGYYKEHFKRKSVFCNCDVPRVSNVFHYFSFNFETLGIKKFIATSYKNIQFNDFNQNDFYMVMSQYMVWRNQCFEDLKLKYNTYNERVAEVKSLSFCLLFLNRFNKQKLFQSDVNAISYLIKFLLTN